MKIVRQKPVVSQLYLGLIYGAIGLLGFLLARFASPLLSRYPTCMFYHWTGIPCPMCGATRSAIQLSHLKIVESFVISPFFFFFYIALMIWGINSLLGLVLKTNYKMSLSASEEKVAGVKDLNPLDQI